MMKSIYAFGNSRFAVPLVLLILAFIFVLPGLPPFRVEAPMDNLLAYPPWQTYYAELTPYTRGGDVLLQQLPWHQWMQDELRAGRFPLWASGPLGGVPLFSHYQIGVLYPLHLLWALLPTGAGLGIIVALKVWLAGVGTWLFLRALKLGYTASLLGALSFMFSTSFVVWLPWDNTNLQLLLPWLCLAVYAWCVERKRGALVGLVALTACAIFAGNPEILTIVGLTVALWTFCLLLRDKPRQWPGKIAGLLAALVAAIALGAIQLLPFLEALGESSLAQSRGGTFASLHIDPAMLWDWLLPRWWGGFSDGVLAGPQLFTEANGYVGLVAMSGVLLVIVAAVRRQAALNIVLPFLTMAVIAFVLSYDDTLGNLVRGLPLLNQMISFRWIQSAGFALIVLGALGWDWLIKRAEAQQPAERSSWAGLRSVGPGLLVLGAVVLLAQFFGVIPDPTTSNPRGVLVSPSDDYRLYWAIWSVAILACIAGLLMVARTRPDWKRVLGVGLSILVIADLWRLLYTYNETAPADLYYPTTSFIQQTASLVPSSERILVEGDVMPANVGLVQGLRDWRSNDPMLNVRSHTVAEQLSPEFVNSVYSDYNMILTDVNLQMAPAFGMRYYIFPSKVNPNTPDSSEPNKPDFTRLAFKDGLGLWEAVGVPGFAYLSDSVRVATSPAKALDWVNKLTWEEMRAYSAMVEAPANTVSAVVHDPKGTSPGSVNVDDYSSGHIVLKSDAVRPSLLVVAESYYPGWHATIDGQPVQILRANYISQGVVVPAGKHTIEMKYEPDSFRNGAMISLAGLVGLAGLVIWWRKEKKV